MKFVGKLPVNLKIGLPHYAQWGGIVRDTVNLPASFKDFYQIFWAFAATGNVPQGEINNRLGNHLGTGNAGIEISFKAYRIKGYWQNIIDDQSGLQFKNIQDGLWGLKLDLLNEKSVINGILIEYIHTLAQSGPLFIPK